MLKAICRPPVFARLSGTPICPHSAPAGCCLSAAHGRSAMDGAGAGAAPSDAMAIRSAIERVIIRSSLVDDRDYEADRAWDTRLRRMTAIPRGRMRAAG